MKPHLLLAPFITLVLTSCAPDREKKSEQIDSLRSRAEQLIQVQSLMGWNNWVFGTPSNQDSLYREHSDLFTLENIELVRSAEGTETDVVQQKRLRYFRRYLTTEFISKEIAVLTDSINNVEASATVTVDGEEIPYREVSARISGEPDQSKRRVLYTALDSILESLNGLRWKVEETNLSLARDLGYESYNTMIRELKGIDLDRFRLVCERVLSDTENLYLTLLNEQLELQPGLTTDRFYRFDTGMLLRNSRFLPYFPAGEMMVVAERTFAGMGIGLSSMPNLHIDAERRDNKNPRAVCFPVQIPDDVRVSIKPNGGHDDYLGLFHEIGHGLHYASTTEHSLEFRYLGEPTVTETFAFLCQYLLSSEPWLRLHSTMPTEILKDFVRFQAFYRLYFIRRYSAKFLYELHLHSGKPDPAEKYAELMSSGTAHQAIPSDQKRFLTDLDALYYSAGYLRAWFLEAQVSQTMVERFGANWFENPKAGSFLKALWARGDRFDGNELASELGYEGIAPDALLDKVNMMMLFSTK